LIDRMVAQNPALQPFAEHLQKLQLARRSEQSGPTIETTALPQNETTDDAAVSRASASESEVSGIIELRAQAESMFAELQHLRDIISDLAAALGACPMCWGEDTDCRSCHGRGEAGFSAPDPELFLKYVVPAARMWRLLRPRNHLARAPGSPFTRNGHRKRV
jgi:hypothetical protein